MDRLEMTEEQRAEIERDKETVRGIDRANVMIRKVLATAAVLAILFAAASVLVDRGPHDGEFAPKRWKPPAPVVQGPVD